MRIITRRNMEAALTAIEMRLASESESIDLQADRARLLAELGQTEQAKRQYLEILKHDHRHLATLINFSVLLYQTGFTSAARIASQAAITFHPDNPKGHTNFADLLVYDKKLETARAHYEAALRIDPGHLNAHRGLAVIFWELGDEERRGTTRAFSSKTSRSRRFPIWGLESRSRCWCSCRPEGAISPGGS